MTTRAASKNVQHGHTEAIETSGGGSIRRAQAKGGLVTGRSGILTRGRQAVSQNIAVKLHTWPAAYQHIYDLI